MPVFVMFGKYSSESLKCFGSKGTGQVVNIIKKFNGVVKSMYSLLGEYDLVFIVNFPSNEKAMKASISINKLTGIAFSTLPTVSIDEFESLKS